MELLNIRTIHGPNIFHSRPVLVMKLDLQSWAEVASDEIPEFVEKLKQQLPGLHKHTCSPGYEGGFYERLQRGTYLAHIIEHVALELSALAGIEVTFGKSRFAGESGIYQVVTRFTNEEGMKCCLKTAFHFVNALLKNENYELSPALERIRDIACETAMGPSTAAIFEAARKFNIPCRRVGEDSLLYLGYGKNIRRTQTAVTEKTSLIATELVQDKDFTKNFLRDFSVPVPRGEVVTTLEEMHHIANSLTRPLAVKPVDGHHGNGITLNVSTEEQLVRAFEVAKKEGSRVLVEEMVAGMDYRLLVIDKKLVAAAERQPPFVVGDGTSSVATLLNVLNQDPRRADGHSGYLTKVEIDDQVTETLKKSHLTLECIPALGQKVFLKETANLSTGGTAKDVTDQVHPEIKALCERVARLVDLDICGIDAIATNLSDTLEHSGFRVIEVNAGPGLRMHLAPTEGQPRPVAEAIVRMLYPDPQDSRIPILAVTGTNGKTTIARMMAKMFAAQGHCVGMTSSDGVWIGSDQIMHGDTSGPVSARAVLNDPAVEVAVLEVARGGIMRGGLAYDWSDVGIITNIRNDHFGQDGIDDIEDLVWVKSLVAERVREGGTLILNADDEQSLKLSKSPRILAVPRKLILYSTESKNPALLEHLAHHQDACWVEDGHFVGFFQGQTNHFGPVQAFPVTLNGLAQFQISNTLAVLAAGLAQGISPAQISLSLRAFNPNAENPGRLNLYKIHDATVILDYGHNPDAIRAIGKLLSSAGHRRKTAVFGLPGDRQDNLIYESGSIIGNYFDRVILRDDLDLRGRANGEVPGLLKKAIEESKAYCEIIEIPDEQMALERALNEAIADEIIVIFYDRLDFINKIIKEYDPAPLEELHAKTVQLNNPSQETTLTNVFEAYSHL